MKWLDAVRSSLRQIAERTARLDRAITEADIGARRSDVELARRFIAVLDDLKARGIDVRAFCASLAHGCSYPMMRRRIQLMEDWKTYVERRRDAGDCGRYGLMFALELISDNELIQTGVRTDSHCRESRAGRT